MKTWKKQIWSWRDSNFNNKKTKVQADIEEWSWCSEWVRILKLRSPVRLYSKQNLLLLNVFMQFVKAVKEERPQLSFSPVITWQRAVHLPPPPFVIGPCEAAVTSAAAISQMAWILLPVRLCSRSALHVCNLSGCALLLPRRSSASRHQSSFYLAVFA